MAKKKSSKFSRFFGKKFNLVIGTIIFVLLIGSAFTIDWIFGVGFIFGFLMSVYNEILEKKPLIPIFLFIGALIIRHSLFVLLPPVFEANDLLSIVISLVLFIVIFLLGWKLRKGKWKLWKV
jgi:hypothetical protein